MKYSITGKYNESMEFADLILPIKQYVNFPSVNAGNGYFYFETSDVCSTKYEDLVSLLAMISFSSFKISDVMPDMDVKEISLLNILNDDCVKEDFTVVSNKQTYYNLLQYLEK